MASIKDIAKQAGVSPASVSRYFNNRNLIAEATATKIEQAVKQNDYRPNSMGKGLRLSHSGKILVLMPTMDNPTYLKVLSAIENECYQYGYTVLACNTHNDCYKERSLLEMLHNHYADGAVFFSSTLPAAELSSLAKKYPLVQCCEFTEGARVSHTSIDNIAAAYEAVNYLIKCGHRKIAMLSGRAEYASTASREEGYKRALCFNNIKVNDGFIIRGNYGFNSGAVGMQALLECTDKPTAVFCISDAVAIGALRYAKEHGCDISVIGVDNTSFAANYLPAITSISQPRTELGTTAVHLLLKQINGDRTAETVTLSHTFVIRDSVKILNC